MRREGGCLLEWEALHPLCLAARGVMHPAPPQRADTNIIACLLG